MALALAFLEPSPKNPPLSPPSLRTKGFAIIPTIHRRFTSPAHVGCFVHDQLSPNLSQYATDKGIFPNNPHDRKRV